MIYGNRIVLFAPLYLSNYCVNGCKYCSYNFNNSVLRRKLSKDEIVEEVVALENMGHKRLAIETGEDPTNCSIDYVLDAIDTIYSVRRKNGAIRRVNVNIAATTIEDYKKLNEVGIGTYVLFQETYHKNSYEKLHPFGPKHNYDYHTQAMDRAMEAGISDVGLGVLFGLYKYKYEFVGLMMHVKHLEEVYGVGPHTVSVPRIQPAHGLDNTKFINCVSDYEFLKIIACIRLAVPYTGIIISTRENECMRRKALLMGVSQISGGSSTSVGGYVGSREDLEGCSQFEVADTRSLDDVVRWLLNIGYIPSFCTACYRENRVGDSFMKFSKTGRIQDFCNLNAILTLQEYLLDYASQSTKEIGSKVIENQLKYMENSEFKVKFHTYLEQICAGARDFRF